jgi:hypothetical protein
MQARTRPMNRNSLNLLVDLSVFVGFLAATAPLFTGLAIHEWLSLAVAVVIIVHLLLHWNWIVGITKRLFGRVSHASRVNYLLNTLLFIAFTIVTFTGVMISEEVLPLFGLRLAHDGAWRQLHGLASNASVILIGLHVALHWNWIVNVARRLLGLGAPKHKIAATETITPTASEVSR